MKQLITYFIIMLAFASCISNESTDKRLLLADSLMNEQPDSAYYILKSINTQELSTKADNAFYALLYTQAMYKNLDSIRSDSLINMAVKYYSNNSNQELYTRSLIYKGAAMQDMNMADEALEWYIKAEECADSLDYMNKGIANLRMATLYSENYIGNNEDIEKYKRALHNFTKAKNQRYCLMCISSIGGQYRKSNIDSAYHYLKRSIELSKKINEPFLHYRSVAMLTRAYESDSLYEKSKNLAVSYINDNYNYIDDNIYYDIASSYAMLNMPDSAEFYFNKTATEPNNEQLKVIRLMTLSQIFVSKNNYKKAYYYNTLAENVSIKIEHNSLRNDLKKIETLYNQTKHEKFKINAKNEKLRLYMLILTSVTVLLIIILIIVVLYTKNKVKLKEANSLIHMLQQEKEIGNDRQFKMKILAENHMDLMKQLVDCAYKYGEHPDKFIEQFNTIIKKGQPQSAFWESMYIYLNDNYNNIIDNIRKEYSILKEDEIRIIAMICCKYTSLEMSVYMGYPNNTYIYKKKKLISKKMNLSQNLDDFLSNNG